jgi:hypothetical protein
VTLIDRDNKVICSWGRGRDRGADPQRPARRPRWGSSSARTAYLDHANIFVVEWVEVGRVEAEKDVGESRE